MVFEPGQRVRLPRGPAEWVTVDFAHVDARGLWVLYVAVDGENVFHKVALTRDEASRVPVLTPDGGAPSERALAAMWTSWVSAASASPESTLRPYAHQISAVYGAMLPQPQLRFLLADEPGTGKTVMAGLYLREMRRNGLICRALVVAPAGLVSKWQADFDRFFGGGLRRITAAAVRENRLIDHGNFVVSLELAAVNGAIQDAIDPDRAGWDIVIFDEAHRLTPTAQTFYRVGARLATRSPRALLMTATPHRGSEWLFRHLLHLVDPEIYPDPGDDPKQRIVALRPGGIHFLRRMKEELVDYDGVTKLFRGRRATNHQVPLSRDELQIYQRALDLVDEFFPRQARPLARMVYGKRAASSVYSLRQTLRRRRDYLRKAALLAVEVENDDESLREEAEVIAADSLSYEAECHAVDDLLALVDNMLAQHPFTPSKWSFLVDACLIANGVTPGGNQQAVIFTEYADSAEWIAQRLDSDGYSTRVYSGRRSHAERDEIRAAFMRGAFQIIVSTDAGNEGIDLQVAHVLVNYDIPWSLVRLEQRMGRIHRVGQKRDVELYNLVATETREGATLLSLLENFANAANELNGQMFDSLSLVAELADVRYEEWLHALYGDNELKKAEALEAAKRVNTADLRSRARAVRAQEAELATAVDTMARVAPSGKVEQPGPEDLRAYLQLLTTARVISARVTAADDTIFMLSSEVALPRALGGREKALVSLTDHRPGRLASGSEVIGLAAGGQALPSFVYAMHKRLATDAFRGGAAEDTHSAAPYSLYAFHALLGGAPWSALLRVSNSGEGELVSWDVLRSLVPTRRRAMGPWWDDIAEQEAGRLLAGEVARRESTLREWLSAARRDLANLAVDITLGITNRAERLRLRDQLAEQADNRLARLDELCHAQATPPRLVARLHVVPSAAITAGSGPKQDR